MTFNAMIPDADAPRRNPHKKKAAFYAFVMLPLRARTPGTAGDGAIATNAMRCMELFLPISLLNPAVDQGDSIEA
jgi:hypothetical protein